MRANGIVIQPPTFDLTLGVLETQEPGLIQALLPEATVEGFDERIICRLPRAGEIEDDPAAVSPKVELLGDEFWTVVPSAPGQLLLVGATAGQALP